MSKLDCYKLGGEEENNDWTLEELEREENEFDEFACAVEDGAGLGAAIRDVTQKEYDEAYDRKVKGVARMQGDVIMSRGWYRADG